MQVSVVDKMVIGDRRITADGYLATKARIARTGIYEYAGSELGMKDKAVVRVYRDEATVFSDESLSSFAHKPVTIGHPPVNVTAKNWKDYAAGQVGGKIRRDGDFVEVEMVLMDQAAIDKVNDGTKELSAGYGVDIDLTPGVTDTGEAYDARMVGPITGNHVAIVPAGRAGSLCRIGDAWPTTLDEQKEPAVAKKIMYDGLQVDLGDEAAVEALISKLTDGKAKAETALAAAQAAAATDATTAKTALDAKDAQIATLTAEKATLAQQVADSAITPEKLREAGAAYAKTVAIGKALGVADADGKSEAEIRKAVVTAKLGDQSANWTDNQFEVSFATLAAGVKLDDGKSDPMRDAFSTMTPNMNDAADKAHAARQKYIDSLTA